MEVEGEMNRNTGTNLDDKSDGRAEEIKKRFILSNDGETIYDNKTKLTWDRDFTKSKELIWDNAINYAKKTNSRLPSKDEFRTLAFSKEYPLKAELERIGFLNVPNWTWTLEKYNTTYAWVVGFSVGGDGNVGKTLTYYVVCVR